MPIAVERQLISAVINSKNIRAAFERGVTAEMFHSHNEEWLWLEWFLNRHKRVPSRDSFRAKFPDFNISKADDLTYLCDEVRQSHIKFVMAEALNEAAGHLADGDIDTAVRLMTTKMVKVTAAAGSIDDSDIFTDYADVLADVRARKRRVDEGGHSGIPSCVDSINEQCGGYNPGELIIIAARLGEGKSWMMQAEAAKAAAEGHVVVFDALEQSRSAVTMRIHSLLSGTMGREAFNNVSLMQGKGYNPKDYEEFLKRLKKSVPGRLHVADAGRGQQSILTIQAQIERHQPEIVFVDYITLLKKSGTEWQNIAELPAGLKQLAVSYGIPIVAAAQLNREDGKGKGEPPNAEALAQSDAIGQDADLVITQRQRSRSVIQQKMAKNRNGPGGFTWWLQFQPGKGFIKEISHKDAMDLMDQDADENELRANRERMSA